MAVVKGTCSACRAPLELIVAESFAAATLAAALCPACTEQHFLDTGGCILMLQRELDGARFPLGKVTITSGAVAALAESAQHAVTFLARHVRGDWGTFGDCDRIELTDDELRRGWEATDEIAKINKWNLLYRSDNIMSEYVTEQGKQIWVVTVLVRSGGTTVLLPEEY